ncbi:hypothetical protein F5Y18DRAFT_401420 [Xylariaceae sp. FL1019]|nr:hypothetical protein F5Y18DRAFT_401420 [Xylariaceae sp. FL1019]
MNIFLPTLIISSAIACDNLAVYLFLKLDPLPSCWRSLRQEHQLILYVFSALRGSQFIRSALWVIQACQVRQHTPWV